jgi:monomeric isocitrate dehydrogenase
MKLTWTKTDDALASYALLPILQAYFKGTGVEIETADISVASYYVFLSNEAAVLRGINSFVARLPPAAK